MKRHLLLVLIAACLFVLPWSARAAVAPLHIHDFQIAGDSAYDEFVSISNDGSAPIDLAGYSLSRKTRTGTSWNTLFKFTTGTIAPGQVLVIANSKYTGISDYIYSTTSYSLTADNSIAIIAPDKSIVDLVGYGEANAFEGTPLPNPAAKEVFVRSQDTGDNIADFVSSVMIAVLDPNADKVVISELMPAPSDGEEWFELFNPTNQPVSLAGLKVCDAVGSVHCYFFLQSETLAPLEYKTYGQSLTKITLNNTGDWLELRDGDDNLLVDSGGNYGNADSGISLSLFGSDFIWTKTATPGAQNFFTDTVEVEAAVSSAPKSTSKKVKTTVATTKSTPSSTEAASDDTASTPATVTQAAVKGVSTSDSSTKTLGYTLITLAFLLLLGYNLWEKRDYARKLYDQIRHRDH